MALRTAWMRWAAIAGVPPHQITQRNGGIRQPDVDHELWTKAQRQLEAAIDALQACQRFLAKSIVTSLNKEREAGRSLALLKPEIIDFRYERKAADELAEHKEKFAALRSQQDLFSKMDLVPHEPAPYSFKYRYRTEDGEREGTCQDWEIEATYYHWSKRYGETGALDRMTQTFGEEIPKKVMFRHQSEWALAFGHL